MSVNWERMQQLVDFLETVPAPQVKMAALLIINRPMETVAEARRPSCGTVGCIAGWSYCLFGPQKEQLTRYGLSIAQRPIVYHTARRRLGLNERQAEYMFHAEWMFGGMYAADKSCVIRYLRKAISEEDIMVSL